MSAPLYRPREEIEAEIHRLERKYDDLEMEIADLRDDLARLDADLSAEEEALKDHIADPAADALWYALRDPRQIRLPLEATP